MASLQPFINFFLPCISPSLARTTVNTLLKNTSPLFITQALKQPHFMRSASTLPTTARNTLRKLQNTRNFTTSRPTHYRGPSIFKPFYTDKMFSPYFSQPDTSFTPLFRLLDDFENYNRETGVPSGRRGQRGAMRMFNPKFDMRETENTFELHGELPGISKENIAIDFTDPQTIVIKGRVERSYAPSGYISGGEPTSGMITEGGEESHKAHKATVEDAGEDGEASTEKPAEKPEEKQVTKQNGKKEVGKPADKAKFWYSERSVGEFSRTFGFPCLVDHDGVTASLNDGILTVSVPKAKKPSTRRIAIQ